MSGARRVRIAIPETVELLVQIWQALDALAVVAPRKTWSIDEELDWIEAFNTSTPARRPRREAGS